MFAHRVLVRGICDAVLVHDLAGFLDHAFDTGSTDKHVMAFLCEHEARRSRERIETGRRQRFELHLAVAIGKGREHEERQPVRRCLVERAQNSRLVGVAGSSLEQILGLLPAITAEVFLQQVDHRPEMASLFDVDLEEITHVIK